MEPSRRLLVLSCTRRKRPNVGSLPALERYDGPTFRVLRRYLATAPVGPPVSYVMSAEHGLIDAEHPVACYERAMTSERADQLRESVLRGLTEAIDRIRPTSVMILMGQRYARALTGVDRSPVLMTAQLVGGSIGRQVAVLHDWLYGAPPCTLASSAADDGERYWRGIRLPAGREALLAAARDALGPWTAELPPVNSWYVEVDRQRVPIKWLFSQLTGLPVGSFHSSDARRILDGFGVEVSRA